MCMKTQERGQFVRLFFELFTENSRVLRLWRAIERDCWPEIRELGYPLDSATPYILWFGRGGSDDGGVGGWFYGDSLLHKPKEQFAPAARSPAVEPEGELVQIII